MSDKTPDKFEATRTVVETIKDFETKDQQMIFRWAAESLGLPEPFSSSTKPHPHAGSETIQHAEGNIAISTNRVQDMKSFIEEKKPRSDVQFSAAVAYYYQFLAPDGQKKSSIGESDLLEACRQVGRERPKRPYFTLNNAFNAGLLDRPQKGAFSINSVGENLVAMTLPGDNDSRQAKKQSKKKNRTTVTRTSSKKR